MQLVTHSNIPVTASHYAKSPTGIRTEPTDELGLYDEAEPEVVVTAVWIEVVAKRNTTEPLIIEPAATTVHSERTWTWPFRIGL